MRMRRAGRCACRAEVSCHDRDRSKDASISACTLIRECGSQCRHDGMAFTQRTCEQRLIVGSMALANSRSCPAEVCCNVILTTKLRVCFTGTSSPCPESMLFIMRSIGFRNKMCNHLEYEAELAIAFSRSKMPVLTI